MRRGIKHEDLVCVVCLLDTHMHVIHGSHIVHTPFLCLLVRETKSLAEARRAEVDVHTAMGLYARREAVQVYAKARE